jgi:hypothetical protein
MFGASCRERNGGGVILGVTYDVRERASLVEGSWTTVGSVAGGGTEKSWAPTSAPAVNTYWQLQVR